MENKHQVPRTAFFASQTTLQLFEYLQTGTRAELLTLRSMPSPRLTNSPAMEDFGTAYPTFWKVPNKTTGLLLDSFSTTSALAKIAGVGALPGIE